MKRLLRRLANRWLIAAIAFLAIAVVIWLVGPLLAIAEHHVLESATARVLAIVLVALLWVIILLVRQLWRRRIDRRMIKDMSEVETAPSEAVDQRPLSEIEEERTLLRERFEEAVERLRKSSGGTKRKPTSLYELPWYIIVGPPGCGKTTALINSGIDFPLAEQMGSGGLAGIGGTRNCDWWISNEAVLIDTAGRYTTQDSDASVDRAAWLNFLDLLKKYRRRRPLNGVIIAFSLSDLVNLDANALELHARAIRRRLQELIERLGVSIPVYLILTKADLIAGFVEFFDDLGREERQQVWGATFPLQELRQTDGAHSAELVELWRGTELPALIERLDGRLNERLITERDLQRRMRILGFPQQVATLEEPLHRFLHLVFAGSRFEHPLLWRGVYFSSGTQEGTPIDRLMGALADVAGLGRDRIAAATGPGKSYFITDLLRKVIFVERNLVGADRKAERIRTWVRRGAYAATLMLTISLALAWTTSFTENKAFTADLESRLRHYADLTSGDPPEATDFAVIAPRLDALRELLEDVETTTASPPWSMRIGLYQGQGILEATRETYRRALDASLLPGLVAHLEEQLTQGVDDPSIRYESLKLYLMLADPSRLEPDLLVRWGNDLWAERFPHDPRLQARLKTHLAALIELGPQSIEVDRRLVKWVRERLEQQPIAELVYGRLKLTAAVRDARPLRFEDIAGRNATGIFAAPADGIASLGIPGFFTYRGFYQIFQPQALLIVNKLRGESWVYGVERSDIIAGQLETLEDAVLQLYIDEYIQRWDQLLAQLNLVSFTSLSQAVDVTSRLIRPDTPIRQILNSVDKNTNLTRLPPGTEPLAEMAVEVLRRQNYYLSRMIGAASSGAFDQSMDLPQKRVERHFELLNRLVDRSSGDGLAQIQRLVTDLYGQLSALEPVSGLPESPLANGAASATGSIFHTLRTEAARSPDPLRRWLRQLATNAQTVALGNTGQRINEVWETSIAPVCKQLIEDRYPFYPASRREVNLQDFARLFGEGGVLDTFFAENLEPFVDTTADPWRWRAMARETLGVTDETLLQLQRASRIKAAFFPEDGQRPSVRFSLAPRRLDPSTERFTLGFGGQQLTFETARPAPVDGEWPGRTISNHLTMTTTTPAPPPRPVSVTPELGLALGTHSPPLTVVEPPQPIQHEQTLDGQWAFYRLVSRANLPVGTDRYQVTLAVGSYRHRFELQAYSVLNPFTLDALQKFRCPDRL